MFYGFHIGLQDDGGGDGVDEFLVLALGFAQAGVDHGLVRHHRGEALVVALNRNVGQHFPQPIDNRLDVLGAVGGVVLHVLGLADDDQLHLFLLHVVQHEVDELVRLHRRQPVGDDLQRVGDSDAAALASEVDCHYPCHVLQFEVQKYTSFRNSREPTKKEAPLNLFLPWVGDGIRTHDPRNHNPVL